MPTTSHELVDDDGLTSPEVGRWAEEKYRLISLYAELFSKGMKDKWSKRVYIDLYAGAGFSRIRGTSTILKGSPALALAVSHPFDKYIFCEEDSDQLEALKSRTNRMAPDIDVSYVPGSCDEHVEDIRSFIPRYSQRNTVLCLCLVDPFDFGIKFDTIRKLSASFTDFLVLLAIGMDANRNYKHYVDGNSTKIDEALGNTDWRERWKKLGARRKEFRQFLAAEFSKSMESIGYLRPDLDQMKLVRSDDKNLPLYYYLALFSRHPTANRFWKEVLKYGTDQPSFSWE